MMVAFFIVVIHFIADFIFQAEEWETNKSKSNFVLFKHVAAYTIIWSVSGLFIFSDPFKYLIFLLVTFVAHFTTDYFTSRIVSRKFANNEYGSPIPNFGAFTVIGFDQVLHYGQLFLTYHLLTN
jgi:hypothetical protein